jgi:RNA polymerase sigma factor (sigma-70 family)
MGPPLNEERFLTLLKGHERIVYKVCYIYCRNAEDRKDLAQEVMVQLWKSFPRFREESTFSTWVYRIALNVAISFYRKNKRKGSTFVSSHNVADLEDTPSQAGTTETNLQLLYQFIHQLDELNKALMLLYLEDNSYKDIASILGITETNVSTKINRIKQKLKLQFKTARPTDLR